MATIDKRRRPASPAELAETRAEEKRRLKRKQAAAEAEAKRQASAFTTQKKAAQHVKDLMTEHGGLWILAAIQQLIAGLARGLVAFVLSSPRSTQTEPFSAVPAPEPIATAAELLEAQTTKYSPNPTARRHADAHFAKQHAEIKRARDEAEKEYGEPEFFSAIAYILSAPAIDHSRAYRNRDLIQRVAFYHRLKVADFLFSTKLEPDDPELVALQIAFSNALNEGAVPQVAVAAQFKAIEEAAVRYTSRPTPPGIDLLAADGGAGPGVERKTIEATLPKPRWD